MAVEKQHPNLLLIDDQSIVAEMLQHMLHDQPDITFNYVSEASVALSTAISLQPSVVLVDLRMPLVEGFGIIRQFRSHPKASRIPMILLSSEDQPELKVQGFAEGANDYLVKWPDKLELVARIRYHASAYLAHMQRDNAFSSLRKSQQELAESQSALHHAQKMEAVGKLTGGVAHDFNNVLQIIGGNLQLLKRETADNKTIQRRVNAAMEGVSRGAKLASQLLAFGRRQPLQPIVINAGGLVRNMDELLRRAIGDRTAIETVVAHDLWNTLVDPNQLENVILNLAINARDAMGGEGILTIKAANAEVDERDAPAPSELEPGQYVLITVSDSGVGMSPEVIDRAFEPFFTTKPEGQGTGLGLSMAYGFVKQSGGHIQIESQPGQGTTVKVYLPRAHEEAVSAPENLTGPISGGVETILVVDDEPGVRAATVEFLSSLGYMTLQAQDGRSALSIIESGIAIDLLFTDVVMPGPVSSNDLAEKAKTILPNMQVLFTSGYTKGSIVQDGKLDPQINLLSKPYSGGDLARKIRHMLRKRQEQALQ